MLTVVALFYYLLVAKRMYIDAPERRDPIPVPPLLSFWIFLCVLGVVASGCLSEAARHGRPPRRRPALLTL